MTRSPNDLIRPFAGLRPARGHAHEIAAPPYDVVTSDEARQLAEIQPHSFLRISRAEIDLPPDTNPYSDAVYTQAQKNIQSFEATGLLVRDDVPAYYIYRMTGPHHVQTGVAVSASIQAYLDNRIRKHELTRPLKENDRVRQIDSVNVQTGPVLLVYRADSELAQILTLTAQTEADAVVPDLFGVRHELWVVSDPIRIQQITERVNRLGSIYIADGHHRSAAAARVAELRQKANLAHDGHEPYNGFLAVAFPDNEVTILDYNRLVVDLNGRSSAQFLESLSHNFEISPSDNPVMPIKRYSFGMYLDGRWFSLIPTAPLTATDPVERLDVSVLDRLVIAPLLGITDPRTDPQIDFVGGSRGAKGLSERVDSGEMAVGFSLFPTSLEDLMAVADAGKIMPPKSTWFDPKLADGLVSLPL